MFCKVCGVPAPLHLPKGQLGDSLSRTSDHDFEPDLPRPTGRTVFQPDEIRTISSTGGEKGAKPQRFSLLPVEALEKVAELYGKGAAKYAAHNWRRGYDWSKSYDALMRHANAFWRGEDIDEEMQTPHMAAVAFHALTLLTFMEEQPDFDDRYKKEESNAEENHSNDAEQQQGPEEGPSRGRNPYRGLPSGSPDSGG